MRNLQKSNLLKLILVAVIAALFSALPVTAIFAEAAAPTAPAGDKPTDKLLSLAPPDPMNTPVLAGLINSGAKVFYLGNRSGLNGWFILKDHQLQIAYITADGEAMAVGGLFSKGGENITGQQIANLAATDKNFADIVNAANAEAGAINGDPANKAVTDAVPPPGTLPSTPISPGDKLLEDFAKALTVRMGINVNAPEIFMVLDPECAYCHDTWKALRPFVLNNSLRVRMIPVVTMGTDNEQEAEALVMAHDPLAVWDKFVAGNKSALSLSAPVDPVLAANLRGNHVMIDQWNIHNLPYLAYRGKDGKVKIVQGKVDSVVPIINDLQ